MIIISRTIFVFVLFFIADNYRSVASELCQLAKEEGSRDNISVIVVYLKEPHLIAKQNWPSSIQQTKEIMENLNMYEEPPVANSVTMDALGNTNQVSLSQFLNESLSCVVIVWNLSCPRTFLSFM